METKIASALSNSYYIYTQIISIIYFITVSSWQLSHIFLLIFLVMLRKGDTQKI